MELVIVFVGVVLAGALLVLTGKLLRPAGPRRPRRRGAGPPPDHALLELSDDGFVLQAPDGRIEWVNAAFEQLSGWGRADAAGRNLSDLLQPPDLSGELPEAAGGARTVVCQRRDGSRFWNEMRSITLPAAGRGARLVTICRDVTELVKWAEAVSEARANDQRRAHTDALTGLMNRPGIDQAMEHALAQARESGQTVALFQIELQKFRALNNLRGLKAGDAALRYVAGVLTRHAGPLGAAARNGADRFVLMIPGLSAAALGGTVRTLAADIARPVDWNGTELRLHAKIGAVAAEPGDTPPAVRMRQANYALEQARADASYDGAVFNADLHRRWQDESRLTADLAAAFERREICVFFQPVVDLEASRILGFEALVRWHQPGRGWLPPREFLPRLRALGLSDELDSQILEESLSARRRFEALLCTSCHIALNVTARQAASERFRHKLDWAADTDETPRERIQLELQPHGPAEAALPAFDSLLGAGYGLTLDGFGTGHAPFELLGTKGKRGMKLDAAPAPAAQAVLPPLIDLAHRLQVTVIATGISTPDLAARMIALGCPLQQGDWVARPMPLGQCLEWIAGDPVPALRQALHDTPDAGPV